MNTSSNNYVSRLKLDFDPFEARGASKDFFPGGGRQAMLDELVAMLRSFGALLAVTGELGVGKTMLAQALTRALAKEAVCVQVQATLFMSRNQFVELLLQQLQIAPSAGEGADKKDLEAIAAQANALAQGNRKLVLVIDDAQELASDVYDVIARLCKRSSSGGFCMVLLGEPQLGNLLQRGLPSALNQQIQFREFPVFSREDSEEYARFKLARAGFRKSLPLSGGEMGRAHNAAAGHPGKLNAQLSMALNEATRPPPAQSQAQENSSIAKATSRYWFSAAGLVMLLVLVVLWPVDNSDPGDSGAARTSQSIPVVVNRPPADAIADSGRATRPAPAQRSNDAPVASTPQSPDSNDETPQALAARPEPPVVPATERVTQIISNDPAARSEPVAQAQDAAEVSAFERSLLDAAPGTYTVQLLGARSVASIQQFLAAHANLNGGGYFETRFQNQPWYVAVAGIYNERRAAEAAIAAMPESVRELQPWVRSVADIQANLRDLHSLP